MTATTPARPSLRANFAWLLAERGWRMAIGLVVGLMITRHLAPQDFGLLSFAFSLNSIFGAVVGLGIDDVLARELVRRPREARWLVAVGFRTKLMGAAGSFVLALLTSWLIRPGDWQALTLVAWVTSGLFLLPADIVELLYQSREKMRTPALVRQGALGATALVRLGLVVWKAPLWCFAAAVTVELAFIALAFGLLWYRQARPLIVADEVAVPHGEIARKLLREGFPLLLSGFLVVITMHCDRLLLIRLAGEKAAGLYAAVARMTELMHILPVAMGAAFLPRLAAQHARDPVEYLHTVRQAGLVLIGVTLAIAVGVSLTAPFMVPLVLGEAYRPAANIWVVHVWTLVCVAIVSLRSRLWVVEGRTTWILAISGATAAVDILANFWLIPRYGASGAAGAAVIAWVASALVLPWCAPGPARSMRVWLGWAKPG